LKKKPGSGEKDNAERWLLTYADLITLLLIFFVVMYALSSIDAKKFEAMAVSMANAMGGSTSVMPNPGEAIPPGVSTPDQAENDDLEQLRKELQDYIDENGLEGQVTVNLEERGIVLSFQDVALFSLGSAVLTPYAKELIDTVGLILIRSTQYVRVEGHTDDLPINTREFPSNWELSAARANSVVQTLIADLNFPPHRLSVTGYGEFRPQVPNDSVENRQVNRRVDIVVLRSVYETAEPGASMKPPYYEAPADLDY
jgi:chemotaxis protein MotB